jgi:Tol biopolymer transport system component
MKKRAALIAFLTALHLSLLGLATALGQSTPTDILAFVASERPIDCGAEVKFYNIMLADLGHNLSCNLAGMDGHVLLAGWSPDGTRIAIETGGTVYIADSRMSEVARFEQAYAPSWSVNGTLVFENLVGNIFTVDQNGENRQFLTSRGITGHLPRWSLDGTQVVFYCDFTICIVNSDGQNLRQLIVRNDSAETLRWSEEILVIHIGSMYLIDRDGENLYRLARDYFVLSQEWLSYDGRQAAFYTSAADDSPGAVVVNSRNYDEQRIFSKPYLTKPGRMAWSPNGSQLAFDFDGIYLASHCRWRCPSIV